MRRRPRRRRRRRRRNGNAERTRVIRKGWGGFA